MSVVNPSFTIFTPANYNVITGTEIKMHSNFQRETNRILLTLLSKRGNNLMIVIGWLNPFLDRSLSFLSMH